MKQLRRMYCRIFGHAWFYFSTLHEAKLFDADATCLTCYAIKPLTLKPGEEDETN